MKIQILNRWTLKVQFEHEVSAELETASRGLQLGEAIKFAYKNDAVLSDADLRGAVLSDVDLRGAVLRDADLSDAVLRGVDLRGAVLSDAVLSGADLRGAVLRDAVLRGAVLSGAVLSGADLRGAVLSGAVLSGAVLRGVDLRGAVLSDAVLSGADLRGAVLRGADLRDIKNDFFNVLLHAKNEVNGLAEALRAGKVDGSVYEGKCSCLVGTIANVKDCPYNEIPGLEPDSYRPAEKWFLNIYVGDTPENNQIVKITLEWISEFQELLAAK